MTPYQRYEHEATHEMALDAGEPQMEGQPCGEFFLLDEQATRDAALGAAVREAMVILIGRDASAADMSNYTDGMMYASHRVFFGAIANALAVEAVADAKEASGGRRIG